MRELDALRCHARCVGISLLLMLAGSLATVVGCPTIAAAADYPGRAIRLVIGFGAGGPTDTAARVLADEMTKRLGQQVFVENRPGAAGSIATREVAGEEADGYTFLIGALPLAVNQTIFPDLPVKFGEHIVAIMPIGSTSNVLVVNPSMGVASLEEFRTAVLARPGKVSHAVFGKGSSSNLSGVSFDRQAGTRLLPVPYKSGADAAKDLLGSHVDSWFAPLTSVAELVKSGKLVALGITGRERSPMLQDVPTFIEQGYKDFNVVLWVGVFARKGIPRDRMAVFSAALADALASAEMQSALASQGMDPMHMNREEFTDFVHAEIGRWAAVLE